MNEWKPSNPVPGDQIRVKRTIYYHHGIYVGDGLVIHFAGDDKKTETSPEQAYIHQSTIEEFLCGGELEVRIYDKEERKDLRSKNEIIALAKSELGNRGYDFLKNNCEDFSNRCAFKSKHPTQVDEIKNRVKVLLKK